MKTDTSLFIKRIFIFSFLLSLFVLPFVLPQEVKDAEQNDNSNNQSKIIDEIKNLSFWDGFCYGKNIALDKNYKDAVFVCEWLKNKFKEESEKYPIFYYLLGGWCSFIKEFDKSFEYFSKAFKLQNYPKNIPENPEERKKIEIEAYLFVIHEMFKNSNQFSFLTDECLVLATKFKQIYPEEPEKVSWVFYNIEMEKKEKAEFKAVQKNIMQLGQEFLNKEAEYVNKKDKVGLYKFLLENSISEERARGYTNADINLFFSYEEVYFVVIDAVPCLEDSWCIVFKWWTKPTHNLLSLEPYMQTDMTVKVIDNKIYLVQ